MLQEEKKYNAKCGMNKSIFTVNRTLSWWEKYGIVGQGKSALSKSAFYKEIDLWDPLVKKKKDCIKARLKELSAFEYCCP